MNFNELKELIKNNLSNGTFKLATKDLPRLKDLGDNYLAGGNLDLSSAALAPETGETITVKGKGTALPFKDMAVTAEFYLIDGGVALDLTATTGKKDWKFHESIPAFKDTIAEKIPFKEDPKPAFYLLSDAKPAKGDTPAKAAGLTFDATVDVGKIPDQVKDILGIDKEKLTGPVVLKNNGKDLVSIELTGPDIVNVGMGDLGTFKLTVKVASDTLENADKTKKVVPFVELSTFIPIKGDVNIEIVAKISDTSSVVRFDAKLDKVISLGFNALADKFGDLELPSGFELSDHVELAKLYIDFNIKEKKVSVIAFKLASKKGWEITKVNDNPFMASELSLQFGIDYPHTKEKRGVSLKIEGQVTLEKKASLVISAAKDKNGLKVKGSLKKDSILSIKNFIKQFVGPADDVPDIVTIYKLDFNKDDKGYAFNTALNGAWQINGEQGTALSVKDLTFDLSYKTAGKERKANFAGALKVDNIDIKVTAKYEGGKEPKGWTFTGATGADQQISMENFFTYLAANFKTGNPPAWLKKINIHDLATSFNTKTKDFDFSIKGNIPVGEEKTLYLELGFDLAHEEKTYQSTLAGEVTIDSSLFKLKFAKGDDENSLAASWNIIEEEEDEDFVEVEVIGEDVEDETEEKDELLQFDDIVSVFGLSALPPIPDGLKLSLKAASLRYDFDQKAFVFTAISKNYGHATFVSKKIDEEWVYAFGINMRADVKLEKLPLIGADLAKIAGKDVGLNGIKLIGISTTIAVDEITAFNELINIDEEEIYPMLPESDEDLVEATYVVLQLDLGKDNTYDYKFNTGGKKEQQLLLTTDTKEDDGIKWKNLQKKIGPVHFNRVGIGYKDKRISLLLDAALVFSVLKIEMLSLGVSNSISKFDPEFDLSGVNISYKNGPVEIAGSFLKTKNNEVTEYSGTAVVALQNFRMSALGSYASIKGEPSLFVFAMLTSPPPGGPPCFFVTGIAAGFGYNRSLKLPTIDHVAEFPFVKAFSKKSPFKDNDPKAALQVLMEKDLVPIDIGQNWLAAGVQFTSFQMVNSFALMTVLFGTTFEIGILGTSEVSMPPAVPGKKIETPLAFAQLALNARILPDTGVISIEAKLTPESYILSKKCVLTGGFAFYIWTAPSKYEGDFVITLGGYHPDFKVPAHYPKVPRLGFNWQVSKEVLIKGAMYFAITPTCLMAGGLLEATYVSGNLKAWFIMGADFLIAWKPYYYSARMYVSFGVQYTFDINLLFTRITETISVCIGADLKVWGPDFSGVASIHLWIISFDVSFGAADSKKPAAITWDEFTKSFLPPPTTNTKPLLFATTSGFTYTDTQCNSKLTDGLIQELKPDNINDLSWIVTRDRTVFETHSVYPIKEFKIKIVDSKGIEVEFEIMNDVAVTHSEKGFGVGMVNVESKDFESVHSVLIELDYEVPKGTRKFAVTGVLSNIPKSLWEKRTTGFDADAMIENVLVGFQIRPQAVAPKNTLPIALSKLEFFYKKYGSDIEFTQPKVITESKQPEDAMALLKRTINNDEVVKTRSAILNALKLRGRKINTEVKVNHLENDAEDILMAPPLIKYTYWREKSA